jgi:hypothetical protein
VNFRIFTSSSAAAYAFIFALWVFIDSGYDKASITYFGALFIRCLFLLAALPIVYCRYHVYRRNY